MIKKSGNPFKDKDFINEILNDSQKDPKASRFTSFDTTNLKLFVKSPVKSQKVNKQISNPPIEISDYFKNVSQTNDFIPHKNLKEFQEYNLGLSEFSEHLLFMRDYEGKSSNHKIESLIKNPNQACHSRHGSHFFGELCPIYEYEDDLTNQQQNEYSKIPEFDQEAFHTPRLNYSEESKGLNYTSPLIKSLKYSKNPFSTEGTYEDSRLNSQKSLQGAKYSMSLINSDSEESFQKTMTMTSRPFYPGNSDKKPEFESWKLNTEEGFRLKTESYAPSSHQKKGRKSFPEINSEKYKIIMESVLSEKRTTLMIKNIANKYDFYLFLSLINKNFEGKYDFFYLPIDFKVFRFIKNNCNIGYAFINIPERKDILDFYLEFNNRKWEHFNSDKVQGNKKDL